MKHPHMVFVGGFGSHQSSVERVAEAMEREFGVPVEAFTFADAFTASADKLLLATRRVPVVTHSAGMLPVVTANPENVVAYNPPLPTSRRHLVGKSFAKTARLFTPEATDDVEVAAKYMAETTQELVQHPVDNLRHLGVIAKFNAIKMAAMMQRADVPTSLVYTRDDVYFQLTTQQLAEANDLGVRVHFRSGEHDELMLNPTSMIRTTASLIA